MIFQLIRKKFVPVGLLFFLLCLAPGKGVALELGLTPSHVYGLWLNINTVFIDLQKEELSNSRVLAGIEGMQPLVFEGKKPANVLALAKPLHQNLMKAFNLSAPPPTPNWVKSYQALEGKSGLVETTPSQVYLLSSFILNSLVEKYVAVSNGTKPISRFYSDHKVSNKTPSDVFGLVDLISRRLKEAQLKISREGN